MTFDESTEGVISLSVFDGIIAKMERPRAEVFEAQTARVESWAALRNERAPEILSQLTPQFPYWSSVINLSPSHARYTNELLLNLVNFSSLVVQRMKYSLACPRPADYSPRIQPMLEDPGYYAFPSGHATQAYAVFSVLSELLAPIGDRSHGGYAELQAQLFRQAERIATNRVVAGLHFPVDSAAGCALGLSLGEYFSARCTGTAWQPRHFDGTKYEKGAELQDFYPTATFSGRSERSEVIAFGIEKIGSAISRRHSERGILRWLWALAAQEWHGSPPP